MRFLHNILAKAGLIVDGVTQLNTIANATIDTDKFLVSDGGVIKYRTGAQLGSDIGAANLAASTLKHQVKLGEAINKGQAVYVSSADGTNMIVSKASNASEPTSSKTLGLIETSGVLNDQVNVVTEGLLAGLDTSTAAAGDPVWLGTGGNLIFGLANKPYAPAHLVFIGIVTRVQQNNGEIFVKVQNGFELKEIHDVQITTTPSDNTVLAYESATSLYKMKSIATLLGYTPANAARQLTINGTTYDLTADRTWSVGTVTSIATTGPITGGTITGSGTIGITQATTSSNGYLSSTDWNTFNNKQNALTLTTTGSSGASTLVGATLNIPTYSLSGLGGVPSSRQLTINGTAYDLSADRSWSVGTVTSVGVSVPTGLSVSNTPVTGSGTIAISFTAGYSIPTTASQTNWDTAYNNRITSLTTTGTSGAATLTSNTLNIPQYQAQGSYITSLTGEATASGPGAASVTLTNSAVIGKVLTGLNVTGGSISATDSILTAFGKLQNQVNGLAGGVTYQGTWNASTNSPSLTSSVGTKGYYYVVSVAGSTNLNGITDWKLGDWAIFNGTSWEKVDNTDAVVSVNGFTGAVSLTTSNISEGTNLYYTDARARAAISLTTTGSSGAATYTGGVLNIPQYSLSGLGGVPTSRQLTINGTAYDLSADRTWTITNISGNSATTSQTNFSSLTVNSNTVLHAGNYNSYAPTLTGTGASGTWGINITGSATTWNGLNFNGVSSRFTGDLNTLGLSGTSGIYNIGTGYTNGPSSGLYGTLFGIWNADISVQFWASYNGNFYWRKSVGNTYTGSTWLTLLDSSNYNSYSPTLTGGGASGTWGISITGNAATATSATNLYGAGGSYIQSTSSGTSYTANYQVRENSGGGSNTNEIYAPQLAFHWSGVVASSIMMESSGRIAIRNNPGSGYESFIAYDVYGSNSMRAPIFYDSNDTNYYVDPNSNSRLVNLGLGGVTPDVRLSVSGDAHISSTFYLGGTAGSSGSWGGRMYMSGGNMYYNALRHELNNVGYGSTWSVIAESGNLILSSGTSGTTGKFILKTTDNSDLNKYIMQDGYWTVIGTHSNEGFRVRDHNGNILLNVAGSTNGYPNRVGIGNTTPAYKLHVSGDIYADGGWLRVSGQSGLYFESYGGGWNMSDTTWIRSYNSKSVYLGTGIIRTDAGDTGFQNLGTTNWYMLDFGDRSASAGRYGVGLTSDVNNRTLSFHVPNHAAYSSSGNVPQFGWYSNGADQLMTLQSATGNLWTKGTISMAGNLVATQSWVTSQGYITSASVGNGTLTLNVSGSGLSGSTSFTANQSGNTTFTVTSNATTSATANTIAYRDSGGDLYARYFFGSYVNTSDNDETGITRFVIKNGDNYHRSATSTTAMTVIRGVASGTWGIDISGNSATTTNFRHLGAGVSYDNDRTTKVSGGLAVYAAYSGGSNSPTTYDVAAQFSVNGNRGFEICADWLSTAGPTLYARSLRDCCQNWSSWITILTSLNYNSYSPTLTGGGASGTWGISISGNSATTSQTNFSSLTVNSATVATQSWVTSQGYITSTNTDFTYNASLTLSTSWQDTGVNNSNLTTSGVYMVTCLADDFAVGGGHYNETYVGTMYWFAGSTNSANFSEIALHHMGHADNDRYIYLRTRTTPSAGGSFLQMRSNVSNSGASTYIFKFKRLM